MTNFSQVIENMKSLMNRAVHVRFCGKAGVKFPCLTRLWTQYIEEQGFRILMDGKGRALDNIGIERFWRSLKYDYVYLNPADDGFELNGGVQNHIEYYHHKVHHTTEQTPHRRYEESIKKAA